MFKRFQSIIFALITAFVCSLLLTGAYQGLKPLKIQNMAADRQLNVLKSVNMVDENIRYTVDEIKKIYENSIERLWINREGRIINDNEKKPQDMPIFLYMENGQLKGYVIPINTRGLWGKIHAYLAFEKDGSTIKGFTVFKHSETPGLGGEIEQAWFRKNFIGKKIVNPKGKFASISIAKGKVGESIPEDRRLNYVDGISGATLTGRFLTAGFREILSDYESVSIHFRNNSIRLPGMGSGIPVKTK